MHSAITDAANWIAAQRQKKIKPKRKPAKRVGYREAVEYLVYNDEGDLGNDKHSYTVCVMMIAALFDKEPGEVARDVYRKRERVGE